MLLWTFAGAGVYTLVSSHVKWLKSFSVFTWVGLPAVTAWGWDVTPSMGYIGQVGSPRCSLYQVERLGGRAWLRAPCPKGEASQLS